MSRLQYDVNMKKLTRMCLLIGNKNPCWFSLNHDLFLWKKEGFFVYNQSRNKKVVDVDPNLNLYRSIIVRHVNNITTDIVTVSCAYQN